MPSMLHEALVLLFQNRPTLAPELVRDVLHQPLPAYDSISLEDANLSQIVPTEYRADLVVLLRNNEPVFGIVVEVQLHRDDSKTYTWPLYGIALRAQHRCPTCVLVVTPDAEVAAWAAQPIVVGLTGSVFQPLVLGPAAVPRITEVAVAQRVPELAVLSVQAHGEGEYGFEVAVAALIATGGLDDERATLYHDLIFHAVGQAALMKLEMLMESGAYEYQSDFVKRYVAQGKAEGKLEGKIEGKAEGKAEGKLEGKIEGHIEALLTILTARKLDLTAEQRQRIVTCRELSTLETWLERAAVVASIDAILR